MGGHCFQKFTLLLAMLQSVVHTDVFECQQSAALLVEIDLCPIDDQVEVLAEV